MPIVMAYIVMALWRRYAWNAMQIRGTIVNAHTHTGRRARSCVAHVMCTPMDPCLCHRRQRLQMCRRAAQTGTTRRRRSYSCNRSLSIFQQLKDNAHCQGQGSWLGGLT